MTTRFALTRAGTVLLALALHLPTLRATAAAPYQDPALPIETRVQDLLARMTLEEKVAQLQSVWIPDPKAFDENDNFSAGASAPLLANGAGSVWAGSFSDADRFPRNYRQQAARTNSIQRYLRTQTRLGLPAFTMAEAMHGFMAVHTTMFPQAIALGSTWDPALVEKVFTATALETSARGIRLVLAPVLDLARDPRWGRYEECYGEDPYLVSRLGLAAVQGLQGRTETIDADHVAVTLKHFAGHGQPEGGRNIAPVNLSEREFRENHLYPFEIAVKLGRAHALMASYNEWDGVPNHVNHHLLTDILRTEWGFDGFVMSDGGGMEVVYENHLAAAGPAETGLLCLAAGLDYDLGGMGRCFSTLAEAVKSGRAATADLDRAAAGILRVKFLSGLFDLPPVDLDRIDRVTATPEHKALARQAAAEAMILLKNENHTLPFDAAKLKKLAVIGPNAADVHLGGYSPVPMEGISVLQGLKDFAAAAPAKFEILYAEGCKLTANHASGWLVNENPVANDAADDARLIDEAVATALKSDAVVLVLGENELLRREAWSADHLGDRDTLGLTGRQHELARAVLATGKPVAVLLLNGGPLAITYLQDHAPAIIEGWYLGQQTGPAVADVLFGRASPSGKLTVTIPRSVGQIPCFYNHKPSRFRDYTQTDSSPLYPFGFGLSYATFDYKNLQLSPAKISPTGTTKVSVDVTNTSAIAADEIVQLYLHDVVSLPVRPVQELKDFARITLAPGETRTVTFELTPDKLAAFDLAMKRTVPPGDFEIMVGRSSTDFLKATLRVE